MHQPGSHCLASLTDDGLGVPEAQWARETRAQVNRSAGQHYECGELDPRGEKALVELAQRDPDALAQLYRQHYPAIARYVHRRITQESEAEDVISEVFVQMVKHLRSYRWRGVPFRIWLYRIATHQICRWARRRRRWANEQLDALEEVGAPAATSEHDVELVGLVLATLPPRLQNVLTLYYLQELPVAEVAQVVRCSLGTVKSRLHEGRRMLRERLLKRGYES